MKMLQYLADVFFKVNDMTFQEWLEHQDNLREEVSLREILREEIIEKREQEDERDGRASARGLAADRSRRDYYLKLAAASRERAAGEQLYRYELKKRQLEEAQEKARQDEARYEQLLEDGKTKKLKRLIDPDRLTATSATPPPAVPPVTPYLTDNEMELIAIRAFARIHRADAARQKAMVAEWKVKIAQDYDAYIAQELIERLRRRLPNLF